MSWKIFELHTYDKNSLLPVKFNGVKWLIIFFLILLSVFLLSAAIFKQEKEVAYIQTETNVNLTHNHTFSKENLIADIQEMPFKYKSVILAQAILESGNFKSPVFRENNNLFGFRLASQRLTFSKESNMGYAVFKNYRQSVQERLIYEAKYMHGLSRKQYMAYLDKVYARSGGKSYSEEIENIIVQNNITKLFK